MGNKNIDIIVAKLAGQQAGKIVVQHIEKLIKEEKKSKKNKSRY